MRVREELRERPLASCAAIVVILGAVFGAINFATPYFKKLPDDYFVAAGYAVSICLLFLLRYPLRYLFPSRDVLKHDIPIPANTVQGPLGGGCFWNDKLVKAQGDPKVYYVRKRVRHHLDRWEELAERAGLTADDLYTIPQREIDLLPEGGSIRDAKSANIVFSGDAHFHEEWEGRAIRAKGEKTVWIVKGDKRHGLRKWEYVSHAGFSRDALYDIPKAEVYAIPEGEFIDTLEKGRALFKAKPRP